MTIKECIDIVNNLKPNQYSIEDKVDWLSFLDLKIINDVLKTHEGYDRKYDMFTGYSPDKLEVQLVVPSPYDRVYTAYLNMKIDEANGETARYNNSASMYNAYLLEFKKWWNKTHMPISVTEKRHCQRPVNKYQITDAMYENLKRELYYSLSDLVIGEVAENKIYDIVVKHVHSFIDAEFKAEDGKDGKDGKDGANGKSAYEYALEGGFKGTEQDFIKKLVETTSYGQIEEAIEKYFQDNKIKIDSPSRIGEAKLLAASWAGAASPYSQVVEIAGVTENSQVDLTPSVEQLAIFYEKDLAFVTENEGGVVTVYAIGQKPQHDYNIQVTITEVLYE